MDVIVDTHIHVWDFSRYSYQWPTPEFTKIYRNFVHQDLRKEMQETPVRKAIHVQVGQTLEETDLMLEEADKNDFIVGVVGWVDLKDPQLDSTLEKYCKHPKFVGCRHIVEAEADDNWLLQEDVQRGLGFIEARNLSYDLLVGCRQLKCSIDLVKKFPKLTFVLDHIAKPAIAEVAAGKQTADEWKRDISELAKNPNVSCKLSSLITQADHENWKTEDIKPFVQHAIEAFGVDRCMFGTDWPVAYLAKIDSYKTVFDTMVELLADRTEEEKAKILGQNAVRIYKLNL